MKQKIIEWQWHQQTICKPFALCSRETTMPAPHHSFFTSQIPFLPPKQQCLSTEGKLSYSSTWKWNDWCVLCVKANLNLQNFDEAIRDFKAVLDIDPDNKAAKNQLTITTHKIKQIHNREKQTYAGMFQKFAEIDAKVSIVKSTLHLLSWHMY